MSDADLILASASPRRRELLAGTGLRVLVRPVDLAEAPRTGEGPVELARRLAVEKALAGVAARRDGDPPWVVGSDTVVALEGALLGKPANAAEAEAMLSRLSGRRHQVVTGWAVAAPGRDSMVGHVVAEVTFRTLAADEIAAYVATGEPLDKAGAYGIQGGAGRFVARLDGTFDCVAGLPLLPVYAALVTAGVVPDDGAIGTRLVALRGRLAAAALWAGRDPVTVTLVGISKLQPVEAIRTALQAGLRDFGENYVQEWRAKSEALAADPIRWHFVGRLQSNKAKLLGPAVAMVHSIDSATAAEALGRAARGAGRVVDVLVQVNVVAEAAKGGVAPAAVADLLEALRGIAGLRVTGLMTVPPDAGPAEARCCFARLAALRDACLGGRAALPHLSMGMTADFEAAVAEGATHVRIGTALFGPRA